MRSLQMAISVLCGAAVSARRLLRGHMGGMRKRGLIGLLFAGTLAAASLSTGLGTAHAATVMPHRITDTVPQPAPQPGVDYELFTPFISPGGTYKCLDDPNGSTTDGQPLVIYHCHGFDANGANQLWTFDFDQFTGDYRVKNKKSGLCLDVPTSTSDNGGLLEQVACARAGEWQLKSEFYQLHFNVRSLEFPGKCMAASNNTDPANTGTFVRLQPCDPGTANPLFENPLQTWQLG